MQPLGPILGPIVSRILSQVLLHNPVVFKQFCAFCWKKAWVDLKSFNTVWRAVSLSLEISLTFSRFLYCSNSMFIFMILVSRNSTLSSRSFTYLFFLSRDSFANLRFFSLLEMGGEERPASCCSPGPKVFPKPSYSTLPTLSVGRREGNVGVGRRSKIWLGVGLLLVYMKGNRST